MKQVTFFEQVPNSVFTVVVVCVEASQRALIHNMPHCLVFTAVAGFHCDLCSKFPTTYFKPVTGIGLSIL